MDKFSVTRTRYGCELRIRARYVPRTLLDDDDITTLEFWTAASGGHIFETTRRPGTTGRQLGASLFGGGPTITATPDTLTDTIAALAREHCNTIDAQ